MHHSGWSSVPKESHVDEVRMNGMPREYLKSFGTHSAESDRNLTFVARFQQCRVTIELPCNNEQLGGSNYLAT